VRDCICCVYLRYTRNIRRKQKEKKKKKKRQNKKERIIKKTIRKALIA